MQEENKKKLAKYESKNVKIEFVDLNYYIQKIQDKLYTRDYYTNTTYFRLFIPNLYPQYDKVIYLDGDTVVLGDISELYNIDMGEYEDPEAYHLRCKENIWEEIRREATHESNNNQIKCG